MTSEFRQITWDPQLEADWLRLLELAVEEDLGRRGDCTTLALVPPDVPGRAAVVARQSGMIAGLAGVEVTLRRFDPGLRWSPETQDGASVPANARLGVIDGPARGILAAERVLLNFLGRLSGVATLTRRYVEAVAAAKTRIYDTRKTTPGWRRLEKYAVRCGGGWNHRTGLFEAVLIKDNHLALWKAMGGGEKRDWGLGIRDWKDDGAGIGGGGGETASSPLFRSLIPNPQSLIPSYQSLIPNPQSLFEAVRAARTYLETLPQTPDRPTIVEVEVDSLQQLDDALSAGPDIILLDNMDVDAAPSGRRPAGFCQCGRCVGSVRRRRPEHCPPRRRDGGGADQRRALTHSAVALDVALDWLAGS